jgi:putative Mg2+ transporter-C (MgtC) family protein
MLPQDMIDIAVRLASALLAGSLIGLERSYHGRPAGFRTHALVCLASALLMLVTVYQLQWMSGAVSTHEETIRTDPTRMAQGIMTGIGFLGAGVIFKEGLTVRGLTTAASIWITAALGILYGIGFYYPAILGTVAAIGVLGAFRWIETRIPSHHFSHILLRFSKAKVMPEGELRKLIADHGFAISHMSYRQNDMGEVFEYRMVIGSTAQDSVRKLASALRKMRNILEFRISPTGD